MISNQLKVIKLSVNLTVNPFDLSYYRLVNLFVTFAMYTTSNCQLLGIIWSKKTKFHRNIRNLDFLNTFIIIIWQKIRPFQKGQV